MPWVPSHQTWQIYWQIYPSPSIEHRFLEDHYTKCGRSTPHLTIDHWMSYWEIHNLISMGNLISGIEKYGDSTVSLSLFLSLSPLSLSLSLSLSFTLSPLDDLPPSIEHRCLEYCYTKLSRSNGRSTPQSIEHRCLEYCYTKLGRSTGTEGVLRERPFTSKGNYLVFYCMTHAVRIKEWEPL